MSVAILVIQIQRCIQMMRLLSAALALAFVAQAAPPTVLFNAPASYEVKGFALSVVAADFNGDGKPDLAVGTQYNSVSILIGKGDGTFLPAVNYTLTGLVNSIAVGDFNGDGKLDLAVASFANAEGTVSILLGNGDGGFRPGRTYSLHGAAFSIVASDFNGDGKLDLAVATQGGPGQVTIFSGKGDGSFVAGSSYAIGDTGQGFCCEIAASDFNGDGHPDLVVLGAYSNEYFILLGNGDGTFASTGYSFGNRPESVAVGDFNGDGKPDLVFANNDESAGLSVLLGNGDGTFQAPVNYTSGIYGSCVVIADFNGDGKPDIAVSAPSGVSVLLGNGDGTLQAPSSYPAGTMIGSLAVADLNGDGVPDLVAGSQSTQTAAVLLGTGQGDFRKPRTYRTGGKPSCGSPCYSVSAAVGDFNGDGKLDLVVANPDLNKVSILLNKGKGAFTPPVRYVAGTGPQSVAVGDFNGDGKLDLVVANPTANSIAILFGNGDGTFQTPRHHAVGPYPVSVAVGDFNNDGKLDVAVANYGSPTVTLLLGNGDGTFQPHLQVDTGGHPNLVVAADFNGDGKADLAVTVCYTCSDRLPALRLAVLLGNGDGTFQKPVNKMMYGRATSMVVGDFNGDGKPDLALNDFSFGARVLFGNGTADLQPGGRYYLSQDGDPDSLAVGDFNGDGKSDLVIAHDNMAEILLGTSKPALSLQNVGYILDSFYTSLAVGDFNGDGKPDLAVANGGLNSVSILLNGAKRSDAGRSPSDKRSARGDRPACSPPTLPLIGSDSPTGCRNNRTCPSTWCKGPRSSRSR